VQAEPNESVGNLWDSDRLRVSANSDLNRHRTLMADYNLYGHPRSREARDRVLVVVTVDGRLEATIREDWQPPRTRPPPLPVPAKSPARQ